MKKRKIKIKQVLSMLMVATLCVGSASMSALAWMPSVSPGTTKIDEFLGVKAKDIIHELESHENDNYYLGTPYDASGVSAVDWDRSLSPNGDPYNGKAGLNCTGFVAYVLRKHGANLQSIVDGSSYGGRGGYANASVWWAYLGDNAVARHDFNSKADLLASGLAQKGDIIYMEPLDWNEPTADCHIGFYWGNVAGEDKFWHSSTHPLQGNQITTIESKSPSTYHLFKIEHNGKAKVKKSSANTAITKNNPCYDLTGTEFTAYRTSDNQEMGKIAIQNNTGVSSELELPKGTYYLKETKAGKGYVKYPETQRFPFNIVEGEIAELDIENIPKNDPVVMWVGKIDLETTINIPQGSSSLAGAEFEVKYYSGYHDTDPAKKGLDPQRSWRVKTNEKGQAALHKDFLVSGDPFYLDSYGKITIPLGSITVQEVKAPTGYLLNDPTVYVRKITESTGSIEAVETYDIPIIKEQIIRGGVEVEKWDKENNQKKPQGEGALEAIFDIYNRGANAVVVKGKTYQKDQIVMAIKTDVTGVAKTGSEDLPYGDYEIIEKTPPIGYLNRGKIQQTFKIVESKKIVKLTGEQAIKNDVIRGGIQVEKWDIETDTKEPQGAGSFKRAIFDIYNRSKNPVIVDGTSYAKDKVVKTVQTDETGVAKTTVTTLPYGKYEVIEKESPEGYLNTGKIQQLFEITEHEKMVVLTGREAIKNNPIRGDLEFIKIADDTAFRLANVPFSITSKTTGEIHVLVTDRNGYASSASDNTPHSQNTNKGETSKDGIWFGELKALNDDVGALLYDTYVIDELPCKANEGKKLIKGVEITIEKNKSLVKLGTITNDDIPKPKISTQVKDEETQTRIAFPGKERTFIDTVSYETLKIGETYIIKGILMDKETQQPLLINEKEVVAEQTFKAAKEKGKIDVKFTFDGSALKGKNIVVFEKLFYNDKEIANHEDIEDDGQTITFSNPNIKTKAIDKGTKTNEAVAEETMTFIDTVSYTGLLAGEEYTVKGKLMDKETKKPLIIEEKEVVAEKTFVAEHSKGMVDLVFTFNGATLKGKAIVVFEYLYFKDREITSHADITDKEQTVTIVEPQIATKAMNKDTNSQEAFEEKELTIIDTVSYKGLIAKEEYTVEGILMDKKTEKPLLVNGQTVTATKTFKAKQLKGEVKVEFVFVGTGLKGKDIVVFEKLFYNDNEIANHEDIEDKGQTIRVVDPKLGTKAIDKKTGTKEAFIGNDMSFVDTVSYFDLVPNKEYVIKGVLMDKQTQKPLLIEGKEVLAEQAFVAAEKDGTVEVAFVFKGTHLKESELVVFEKLFYNGKEIANHENIDDEAQTIKVKHLKESKLIQNVQTGDAFFLIGLGVFLLIGGLLAFLLGKRKR